jgi:hypothetical protein
MRLLHLQENGECTLVRYTRKTVPPYAILSHTWGEEGEEVTFQDIEKGAGKGKPGYAKIRFCAEQARKDNLQYIWVDTCCIDKSSSAELSESLNSMFYWYQVATRCYVYLSDISVDQGTQPPQVPPITQSRWFTRGWTLQELLAPQSVEFFSSEGMLLGNKKSPELQSQIQEKTGIAIEALQGRIIQEFGITERMSWAAKRETSIDEDRVYCLLGIFNIYMPVLYGEGIDHAFRRLRNEINASSGK